MKRILIIGADGMLGGALCKILPGENVCVGSTIDDLDIADCDRTVAAIKEIKPEVVINAAAFTMVDLCEQEKETAFAVNAWGARNVAMGCREAGAACVYLSTDFVFDGEKNTPYKEDDLPNPLSVYGLSKLRGEQYVQEISDDHLIIRTSWLFSKEGSNFVKTVIRLSREKTELTMVNDQKGSPTFTLDLSRAIATAVEKNVRGVLHVANSGSCTWFEFAQTILDLISSPMKLVPITSSQSNRPAKRPRNSVLNCARLTEKTGLVMPPWEDALARCIKTMEL